MRLKIAALLIASTAIVFGQNASPDCYYYNPPSAYGIIVSVQNLALRAPAPAIINGRDMNILANFGDPLPIVASGELLSIIGEQLVLDSNAQTYAQSWTTQPLNGATVLVNGIPAPILYAGQRRDGIVAVAASEILVQLPYGLTGPTASIQVSVAGSTCNGFAVNPTVAPTSTGLVKNLDGTPVVQTPAGAILTTGQTVKAGDELVVYLVGGGDVQDPQLKAGAVVTKASRVLNNPTIIFGGQSVSADYAGLTPSLTGVYQFNFRVPALSPGTYSVKVNTETFSLSVK